MSTYAISVVSSNPAHCEEYSIQHYVIKCINDLRQVGRFLRVLPVPSQGHYSFHSFPVVD